MHPYDILCKVFGSKDVVQLRQKLYSAVEICVYNDDFQIIPSGSRAEGLELKGSDYDLMFILKYFRVYETMPCKDPLDDKISIIMDANYTKLGFTRLRIVDVGATCNSDLSLFLNEVSTNDGGVPYLSSALLRGYRKRKCEIIHGPCLMYKQGDYEAEYLHCLRCKEWISTAQRWASRSRGPWPSADLISNITRYGVLFVPVGYKTSKYENIEWRISFSIAEKQLIHSFTHVQFLCYAMMKTILSDIIKILHGELLCSYFIKTIMFWLSEEKETEFWTAKNIIQCYLSCVKRLIYCCQYSICMHYFIPEINFFEERFDDNEQAALLNTLHDVYSRGWDVLLHTKTFLEFSLKLKFDLSLTASTTSSLPIIKVMCMSKGINERNVNVHRIIKYTPIIMTRFIVILLAYGILKYRDFNLLYENRQIYHMCKSLLPDILIKTKTDCVSGWCFLASMFYQLKLYHRCQYIIDNCINKCTQEKILLSMRHYISIPESVQRLISNDRYFSKIIQHCSISSVEFFTPNLMPTELSHFFQNEFSEKGCVIIPPTVFIFFLDFLCNHRLKQNRGKEMAFRNLHMTVREEYFIVNDYQIGIAQEILNVATNMMHKH